MKNNFPFHIIKLSYSSWENRLSNYLGGKLSFSEKERNDLNVIKKLIIQKKNILERLKKDKSTLRPEIDKVVEDLARKKEEYRNKQVNLISESEYLTIRMEDLILRRFFYDNSFSIYGGASGLIDLGPMGTAIKNNIISEWRKSFIFDESIYEIECSIITPETVLKASGHVAKFSDYMVKDMNNGECYRLDHLVKSHLQGLVEKVTNGHLSIEGDVKEAQHYLSQVDNLSCHELYEIIKKYNIKSPKSGNDLSEPFPFNLMFSTTFGPTGHLKSYLRPETAQGIFVNFKRLYEFNRHRLPFGAAQIGPAFRNEISPRSGLIRVREFCLAEIEYFVHPEQKDHKKFASIPDLFASPLLSSQDQLEGKAVIFCNLKEAVKSGIIANQCIAYFLYKIQVFLLNIGIDSSKLRFRQHLPNEMAHYAVDCWDAEIQLSSGDWIEAVGLADRSCYDLLQHSKATDIELKAHTDLQTPIKVKKLSCVPNKQSIGMKFKDKGKIILDSLKQMENDDQIEAIRNHLLSSETYTLKARSGEHESFEINSEMVTFKEVEKVVHYNSFVPSVIEPSFGIGRILYSLLDHSYTIRTQLKEKRDYFALKPVIAPIKCSILPLSNNESIYSFIDSIQSLLKSAGVSVQVDSSSGSIGRRYFRTDEIGIPFAITIDFDTLDKPHTVTLRERNTMRQIRLPIDEVAKIVKDLCDSKLSWDETEKMFPVFNHQESKCDENGK